MNTSTRATYTNANQAHASTAHQPLLRPEGIVLPSSQTSLCQRVAEAYQRALDDPRQQITSSQELRHAAHSWLNAAQDRVLRRRIHPHFVDRDVPLSEALAALSRTVLPGEWRTVPVSTIGNDQPHPVWTPYLNLIFRLVHDVTHYDIGADDSFRGELDTYHHTLIEAQEMWCYDFPHFMASEIVGQAAYRITYGTFPRQIITHNLVGIIR